MQATILNYTERFFDGVMALWAEAFPDPPPWNSPDLVISAKTAVQPELFLVALDEECVIGTAMGGYDGHRGWLYTVAVLRTHRRSGVGSALIRELERRLGTMGCVKINLQVQAANSGVAEFYRRLGYVVEDRISMGKRAGRVA
jgi:ribosomal protein S18 acetylase RimI-like enzyme